MTVFETDPSTAMRSGIIACVVAGLIGVMSLVFAALAPPTLLSLLLLAVAVAAFVALAWLIWTMRGLNALSYSLDRNSFVIRHGNAREIIPMAEVQRIIPALDIADGARVRRIPLSDWWVCDGTHPALGKIRFYATGPLEHQSIIVTPDVSFGVSPFDLDAFDEAFETRLAMRPTQDVAFARIIPGIRSSALWGDRMARFMVGLAVLVFVVLLAVTFGRFAALPRSIPLHFNNAGQVDRFGADSSVFGLAAIAFGALVGNTLLGAFLFRANERLAGYLAWGGGIIVQLFFGVAAATVMGGG
ncbi:MAG: PH domain-containing protein [Thermoflexales bacterium]